jgi:uncharacterized protein YodC (DUF2158 family)
MNVERNFEPGDVVVLKSGGPKMTVAFYMGYSASDTRLICEYFDSGKKVQVEFKEEQLDSVE